MACNYNCNQGRRCCGCYIADQGLHRHDGPFHDYEGLDEPVVSSEQVKDWLLWLIVVAGVAVILAAVGLPLYFGVAQ